MKGTVKIISLILIMLMMTAMITSCTTDELSFLSTLEKFTDVKSYSATSLLTTNITTEIPSDVSRHMSWPNVKSALNSLKNFKLTTNTTASIDDNKMLSKIEMGVSSEDFMFNTTGYVKADDKGVVETFKIPTTLRWMLPEKNMNAEYLTIDMAEFSEFMTDNLAEMQTGLVSPLPFSLTPKNLAGDAIKLSKAYYKFQTEYAKEMVSSPKVVTKAGNTYKLSLTDESLKLLAKAVADTYLKDAEARDIVEKFVNELVAFYDSVYPGIITTELKTQIFGTLGAVSATTDEYQPKVDEFFEMIKDVPILGKKGLVVNYTTDSKGFISKVDGHIDILVDVNALNTLTGGYIEEEPFNFDILLSFKTEYKDINKTVKIDYPKLTSENNVSYVGILKDMIEGEKNRYSSYQQWEPEEIEPLQLPAEDGSISVVLYGEILNFGDAPPEIIDGVLFVPLGKMADELYFKCRWDFDKNCAVINDYEGDIDVYIGNRTLYGDEFSIVLSHDTISMNDQIYVPFRSFMKSFIGYYNIEWDAERNAAIIGGLEY